MAEEFMHKNKLQDHTQRAAIPLPIYTTVNEGSPHAPQFKSSVIVDGWEFTSNCTFSKKTVAEQYVAKCALEAIRSFIRNNSLSLIPNNLVIFKCILNEYAVKMNLKLPTYETCKGPGSIPMFVSSVSFDNKTFEGEFGNSKKEAEQMGARVVIEFILGNSDSGIVMAQIIKSKAKYATVSKLNGSSSSEIANAVNFNTDQVLLKKGEAIAQIIIEKKSTPEVIEVMESEDSTNRGISGFDSTNIEGIFQKLVPPKQNTEQRGKQIERQPCFCWISEDEEEEIELMVHQTNVNQLEMQNTPNCDPSTSFQLCYPGPPAAARLTKKKARVDEVWASGPHAPQ